MGKFVDALIKELLYELPSFVQDTGDVLRQLEIVTLPLGALLVGIDVESLYTSSPQKWGLKAVQYFLTEKCSLLSAQNKFIVDTLEFMLEHNCFQFLCVNFQQIRGTSMGAPWAPSYAWEDEVVYASSLYLSHCLL